MTRRIALTIVIIVAVVQVISAQQSDSLSKSERKQKLVNHARTDSSIIIINWTDTIPYQNTIAIFATRSVCKKWNRVYLAGMVSRNTEPGEFQRAAEIPVSNIPKKHSPLLKITGNILYDVNYRSRIDTPYAERNLYQHMLQTRIDAVYKDKYPFRLYLTTRFSNSDLFRKYTDLNFQFNQSDFKRMLKARAIQMVDQFVSSRMGKLDSLKEEIEAKKLAIARFRQSLNKPDLGQQIVEEREKAVRKAQELSILESKDDLVSEQPNLSDVRNRKFGLRNRIEKADSLMPDRKEIIPQPDSNLLKKMDKVMGTIQSGRQVLDSLTRDLEKAESLYRSLKSAKSLDVDNLKQQIESSTDIGSLVNKFRTMGIPDSLLPKGYKTLFAIQSLNIGRSTADYSELSVRNVSITGIQVEFNPRYYYAFAAGKVDYRFRDYIVTNHNRSHQFLALARVGKGLKNGNHFYFTYYTGKRQFFNGNITAQPGTSIPEYRLAGITLEAAYKINRNIVITGEVAKSTSPYYSLDSLAKTKWMNSVTDINDRSNEAYSLKLISYFPKSLTRFSGNFRYTGANFQSFSKFTTGASQLRWVGRLEQPLFKKKLTLLSSIQQNDYYNPFVETNYKTSAVLASFQAHLRIKKWPVLSVGYFPSYQLTKITDQTFAESRYYTFSASAGYSYKIKSTQLSSYLVYSRFYNTAVDSNFVYYNSRNFLLNEQVNYGRFTGNVNMSVSLNTDYNLNSVETTVQWEFNKWISAGGGTKLIRHSLLQQNFFGYSANINLRIWKLGDLQLMADKGFIPGLNRTLVENNMGRLTYFKTF